MRAPRGPAYGGEEGRPEAGLLACSLHCNFITLENVISGEGRELDMEDPRRTGSENEVERETDDGHPLPNLPNRELGDGELL